MKIEASDLQQTIKRGIGLYFVLALIAMPSGICSHQHFIPELNVSLMDQLAAVYHVSPDTDEMTGRKVLLDADAQPFEEAAAPAQIPETKPKSAKVSPFHDHIMQAARNYEVDPALIKAIIQAESSYNPRAESKRGAQGLMQLMPTTARSLGVTDSFDPALNIDGGVRYFRQLMDRFEGDVALALAAYNAGSRYVRKYNGVPPFQATRIYIKKVLKYREEFERKPSA